MERGFKRGAFGTAEQDLIKAQYNVIAVEDIAKQLKRDVETVQRWINKNLMAQGTTNIVEPQKEVKSVLRASPEWGELKGQFLPSELKLFEYKYNKLVEQFKSDVLATENTQIFLLIKLEILMDRNLKARQRALIDIQRLENQIDEIYDEYKGRPSSMPKEDKDQAIEKENQLVAAREAEQSKTAEYVKLMEKTTAIMKDLKGTRDQRFSKVEADKSSFIGLIKELADEENNLAEGQDIELMKIATKVEAARLSAPHRYVDDNIDVPLLVPENQ